MRISDWSSGVCSSDLSTVCQSSALLDETSATSRQGMSSSAPNCSRMRSDEEALRTSFQLPERKMRAHKLGRYVRHSTRDRKRVGGGKSVSVRVDRGGRRIIKKKKTHQTLNKTLIT